MPKYLLVNVYNYDNQGEMAQITGLTENLEGEYTVLSMCSDVDAKLCYRLGLRIVGRLRPLPKLLFGLWLLSLLIRATLYRMVPLEILLNKELRAYRDCDMVLGIGGDTFSDDPHPLQTVLHCCQLIPAIMLEKPYVLVSLSIGRFRTNITKGLAKYVLQHARRIIVREDISGRYLVQELGIETGKVSCAFDVGLLLKSKKITDWCGYIGVNVSQIISSRMLDREDYVKLMVWVIDRYAQDNTVVIIPHVTGTGYAWGSSKIHDDRIIAREIYLRLVNTKNVQLINKAYDADYTKGIIGGCSYFIGARFHACLAAISQGVPTLCLAYSHKAIGMFNQVGQNGVQVVDVRDKSYESLLSEIRSKLDRLLDFMEYPLGTLVELIEELVDDGNRDIN